MEETKQETIQLINQKLTQSSPFNSITALQNPFLNKGGQLGERYMHNAHLIDDHIVVIFGRGKDFIGRDLLGDR